MNNEIYGPSAKRGIIELKRRKEEFERMKTDITSSNTDKVVSSPPQEDTKAADSNFFSSVLWTSSVLPSISFQDSNLDRLVTASSWAYVAMTKNAASISELVPIIQERKRGTWIKTDKYDELNAFIDDPLGPDDLFPYWSWGELIQLIVLHRYLNGTAYLKPVITDDRLYALIPLFSPNKVRPTEIDDLGVARAYDYGGTIYKRSDLISIAANRLSSFDNSVAPITAAMGDVITDTYAAERVKSNMQNSFSPGLILTAEDSLNPAKSEETVNDIVENYAQSRAEGLPWLVSSPMKIVPGPTPRDMMYLQTMKWSRESMLAVFGMPPSLAGILNSSNYNLLEQSVKVHWNEFLYPIAKSIYGQLNAQLIRKKFGNDVRIWWEDQDSEIGRLNRLDKIKEAQMLVTMGYSVNVANEACGLGLPLDESLGVTNTSMVIAGRDVPNEPSEDEVSEDSDSQDEEK